METNFDYLLSKERICFICSPGGGGGEKHSNFPGYLRNSFPACTGAGGQICLFL